MSAPQSPTEQGVRAAEPGPPPKDDEASSRPASAAMERRGGAPSMPPATPTAARSAAARQGSNDAPDWNAALGGQPASDRAVDADLLVDIPRLSVEELNLELEASLVLNRVKLDAKGLEVGLFLKSNFDKLAELTAGRASTPAQAPPGDDAARDDDGKDIRGEDSNRLQALGDRALHAAKRGGTAVGVAAAGLAGGALLDAKLQPSRGLPLPRRRSRGRALVHDIRRRLP